MRLVQLEMSANLALMYLAENTNTQFPFLFSLFLCENIIPVKQRGGAAVKARDDPP